MDLSVASGDSHEGVSIFLLASLAFWDVLFQLFEELESLVVAGGNLVGKLLLFDASQTGIHIEGRLSDWNDILDDVPEDTFVAWSGGQRALVSPSLIEVDSGDELLKIKLESTVSLVAELDEEVVVPIDLGLWVSGVHFFKVLFWHDLEEETEDTSSELTIIMLSLVVQEVDNVHFKVEELTVDGVLRWGMEVELGTMEGSNWNMWVEEGNGLSLDAVEVVALRFALGDINEEGVTDLVEFELLLFLGDLLIMELKKFILEILKNWHAGAQVDWGLLLAEIAWELFLVGLLDLLLDLWAKNEVDTWSLGDWVLVGFGVVILEEMGMIFGAAWSTSSVAPVLRLVVEWEDLPVVGIVAGGLSNVDVLKSEKSGGLNLLFAPLDLMGRKSGLALGF